MCSSDLVGAAVVVAAASSLEEKSTFADELEALTASFLALSSTPTLMPEPDELEPGQSASFTTQRLLSVSWLSCPFPLDPTASR